MKWTKWTRGSFLFYGILLLSILMVNPPILPVVNDYCRARPLTLGWPTLWLWLEFWYGVMILDFLAAAVLLKEWNCHQDEKMIEMVTSSQEKKR